VARELLADMCKEKKKQEIEQVDKKISQACIKEAMRY